MANPLKVLTDLVISGSTSTSGSLTVGGNGGLTVSSGTSTVQALTATTISGSSTLQVGGTSTFAGAVNAQNGITVTNAALNASAVEVSASALSVGGGYGSTGVTVSSAGNIQANGTLTVDSTSTLTGQVTLGGNVVASNTGDSKSIFGTTTGTITVGSSTSTASFDGKVIVGGDLVVRGTTTSVDSTTVNIGDKNINLGTGSADLAVLSGGGLDLGTNAEVQWRYDNGNTAWTSNKSINVSASQGYKIGGTSVLTSTTLGSGVVSSSLTSVGTLDSLTVSGQTDLNGAVNLGNASGDIVTATGQLTASQGIDIATGKSLKFGGQSVVGDFIYDLSGQGGGAGAYFSASYVSYGQQYQSLYIGHLSASGYQTDSDVIQLSYNGNIADGYGLIIDNEKAKLMGDAGNSISVYTASSDIVINSHQIHFGGQDQQGGQNLSASFDGRIYGRLVDNNNFSFVTTSSYSNHNGDSFDVLDVVTAIDQLDNVLNQVSSSVAGGTGVTKENYYSLRVATKGTTQSGGGGIVRFFLSGSPGSVAQNEGNTSQVTASCPLGLSGSTGAECLANFAYASLDVAVQINNLWTNDLVSVQVSASQSGSTGPFYPFVTVEAPALSDGTPIKLIVVQEERNKIS